MSLIAFTPKISGKCNVQFGKIFFIILGAYYLVSNKRYDQLSVTPGKNVNMNKRYATKIPLISVTRNKMFKLSDFV